MRIKAKQKKMKKFTTLFLWSFLIAYVIPIHAQYTLTKDDVETSGSGRITNYVNTTQKNIIIPETINGETIVAIGAIAFSEMGIESVQLPNTITTIDGGAFLTNKITSIILPEGLKEINKLAFAYNNLKNIRIPKSVKQVLDEAFVNNEIESIIIEGNPAFAQGCFNNNRLKKFNGKPSKGLIYKLDTKGKPDNKTILSYAGADRIIDFIPSTTITIAEKAFGSIPLDKVIIPSSVKNIRPFAFNRCDLKELVLNEGLEIIEKGAFEFNEIKKLTTPRSLKRIEKNAFSSSPITKMDLNEGLQFIGRDAFVLHEMENKESLTLPKTIIELEGNPFLSVHPNVSLEDFDLTLPEVVTTGYDFLRWEDDKGNTVPVGAKIDNERNYIAVTTPSFFLTVRFLDFDDTLLKEEKVAYKKNTSPPISPNNRPGYVFKEWDTNFEEITSDTEIRAIYREVVPYTATFLDEKGNILKTSTQTEDIGVLPPPPIIKNGFVFFGWNNYDFLLRNTFVSTPELLPIGSLVSVNFVDEDGVTLISTPIVLRPGEDAIAPESPVKKGKIFVGWDKSFKNVTENILLKAIYKANNTLGVEELTSEEEKFSIYPTFVKEKLFIKLPSIRTTFFVDIYNISGKKISTQLVRMGDEEITPPESSGIYLLRLSNHNRKTISRVMKFVKQ